MTERPNSQLGLADIFNRSNSDEITSFKTYYEDSYKNEIKYILSEPSLAGIVQDLRDKPFFDLLPLNNLDRRLRLIRQVLSKDDFEELWNHLPPLDEEGERELQYFISDDFFREAFGRENR